MLTHGVPSNLDAGNGLVESPSLAEVVMRGARELVAGFRSTAFISYFATQNSVETPIAALAGTST
jgi:hypothetical protein